MTPGTVLDLSVGQRAYEKADMSYLIQTSTSGTTFGVELNTSTSKFGIVGLGIAKEFAPWQGPSGGNCTELCMFGSVNPPLENDVFLTYLRWMVPGSWVSGDLRLGWAMAGATHPLFLGAGIKF